MTRDGECLRRGKEREGCARLHVTDEVRVSITAQACLLLLGFEDYYFDDVASILVYPGGWTVAGLGSIYAYGRG